MRELINHVSTILNDFYTLNVMEQQHVRSTLSIDEYKKHTLSINMFVSEQTTLDLILSFFRSLESDQIAVKVIMNSRAISRLCVNFYEK